MKKILFVILCLTTLVLTACKPDNSEAFKQIKDLVSSSIEDTVNEDITLPTTVDGFDCSITWASDKAEVISNEGKVNQGSTDIVCTLTYTIIFNGEEQFGTISITVKAKNILPLIKAWLDEQTFDTLGNISLPTTHPELGGVITWVSDKPEVISNEGIITPAASDTLVTLTFTIALSNQTETGTIPLTVKAVDNSDLVIEWIKNQKYDTLGNVSLPTTHPELGGVITWVSDKPEVIANDGVITSPLEDTAVNLTFTLNINNTTKTGEVSLTVPGVKKAPLIAKWISDLDFGNIEGDIVLPVTHPELGGTISWLSNNPDVISNSGEYLGVATITIVKLDYTITIGEELITDSISINVHPKTSDLINSYINSIVPTRTMNNIALPLYYLPTDTDITWTSTNQDVISDEGVVSMQASDVTVTMNYAYDDKTGSIDVTVVKENSNLINKFLAVEQKILEQVMPTVIFDVVLPTSIDEASIAWISGCPSKLSNTGECLIEYYDFELTNLNYNITIDDVTYSNYLEVSIVGMTVEDLVDEYMLSFPKIVTRDLPTDYESSYDGFNVIWKSTNQNVIMDDGTYTKPMDDMQLDLNIIVNFLDQEWTFTRAVNVLGYSIIEKTAEIDEWLNNVIFSDTVFSEYDTLSLPTEYEKYKATITWTSSNVNVIDQDGNITFYPFDRYVDLNGVVVVGGKTSTIDISLLILAKANLTDEEKINLFLDAIAVKELPRVTFNTYSNITQTYNILPLYNGQDITIVEEIVPVNDENRPGIKLYSVEFITVHDTANNGKTATAKMHSAYVGNGGGGTSWHYSVDEDGAYHQIPNDEVAYHAGDGSRAYGLNATGVKATRTRPVITITADGYYALNGEKSLILAPTVAGSIGTTEDITPSGIYVTIINGEYYINNTYFNTNFNYISNQGGNRNSIGIETCVNNGSDYMSTVHVNAKLVAKLCIENNLSLDRILQHNNFSGKPCPNAIRQRGYWNEFLDLVSLYKFAKTSLGDYTFVWKSNSSIMTDDGKISSNIASSTSVNYSVTVTKGQTVINKSFTTNLISK